jgi:hypothetical protein
MSAIDMGITEPCPFCGCRDAPDIVYAKCEGCDAQGPPTRVGCRDEDEDGPIDLEREALEFWNERGAGDAVTVEQIPSDKFHERLKLLMDDLSPAERAIIDRRFGQQGGKKDE